MFDDFETKQAYEVIKARLDALHEYYLDAYIRYEQASLDPKLQFMDRKTLGFKPIGIKKP